jgi:hypothetical protein
MAKKNAESDDNDKKKKVTKSSKKTEGNFFDDLLKKVGVEMPVASEVDLYADIKFFDTGSLALNAALSGSTNGGIASKVTALAGEESTGKTYIALQIIKSFLDADPKAHAFIFDSEEDPSKGVASLVERDIDPKRVHIMRVKTIQEFRNSVIRIINGYLDTPEEKRLPMFFCLDSLGNLSTHKEVMTIDNELVNEKGEDVQDMTRPKLIRGIFRVLSIKLGMAGVPMLITNHTYDSQSAYVTQKQMCLVEGTKILGVDGPIAIENIKTGDLVRTAYGEDEPVSKVYTFDSDDVYEIEFENGSTVQCTGEHKFLLPSFEWCATEDLINNDVVLAVED